MIARLFATHFLVLTALATLNGCQRSGDHHEQAVLSELQQTLAKAWVRGDREALERILAQEWSLTGPDGRRSDRARVLGDVFERRVHQIHRLEVDDVRARIFGDAAVVTGRTRGAGTVRGVDYDVTIRFTDMFIRRDGQWQAVASHASLLAATP